MLDRIRHGLARPAIFISYRRNDSGGYAGQLRKELEAHYGSNALFLDHQEIRPGDQWEVELQSALDAANVVLVAVGPDWVTIVDHDGKRRLDDAGDWVRREVEAALGRPKTVVIPVLVGDASLPTATELPPSIVDLNTRQWCEIRPDKFNADVKGLIRTIGGWRSRLYGLPIVVWPALVVVLALIAALAVSALRSDSNRPPELPAEQSLTVESATRTEIDLLEGVVDDGGDVVLNDVDPLSVEGAAVTIVDGGIVAYQPVPDYHGSDVFSYRVADDQGAVSTGNVLVEVSIGPMNGDFNVAVAEFAVPTTDGTAIVTDDSRTISETVFTRIDDELGTLNESGDFNFDVRSPADTGSISGATRAERAAAARELAEEIQADVVVYGTLSDDEIAPEFFVQSRGENLANAEELAGDYELGERILGSALDAGSITERATLREALSARARSLTQFVIGLSWYSGRDYKSALAAFGGADDPKWLDQDGKEILYLFLGNASGKLRDLNDAEANYETALTLNPEFARAMLGNAEVLYFRAAIEGHDGVCAPGDVDVAGLQRSEQTYLAARSAADQPAISNVAAKSAFGLGRVYICMTLAGVGDRSEDAGSELRSVIDEFGRGNGAIRNLAAESYANLAVVALELSDAPPEVDRLCDAVGLYDNAIELTEDEERASLFADNRSTAVGLLDDPNQQCR